MLAYDIVQNFNRIIFFRYRKFTILHVIVFLFQEHSMAGPWVPCQQHIQNISSR
jgi:hypothetical protein